MRALRRVICSQMVIGGEPASEVMREAALDRLSMAAWSAVRLLVGALFAGTMGLVMAEWVKLMAVGNGGL